MKPVDSPSPRDETADLAAKTLLDSAVDDPEGVPSSVVLGPAMNEVLARLADGAPARSTLLLVLSEVMEIIDSERIFLFRLRREGGFHVLAACNRDRQTLRAPERRMSHYAVKVAMDTGEPLFIPDARQDRRYRAEEVLDGKKGAHSILVLPLRVGGELLGGIYADHRFHELRMGDTGTLRAWLSVTRLVLGLREQHRSLRRRRREAGESRSEEAAGSGASTLEKSSAARSRRASAVDSWIEVAPDVRNFHGFLSANPDLKDAFDSLDRLGAADLPVLIYGETGTGKSLLARCIHEASTRRAKRLVSVHHGSVPESLIESELLGHVRGAFSGADADQEGLLVQADGGTLFLDEIGDMGADVQTKLLRVLEDGVVRPIGAKASVKVDVRVIAATRHRLESRVEKGQFRRDLYFRLKGVEFEIPPLRDRREDILPLCRWFLARYGRQAGGDPPALTREACRRLVEYPWPGNVRELENEMRRLVALGVEKVRRLDLAAGISRRGPRSTLEGALPSLEQAVSAAERDVVEKALLRSGGNRSQAAQALRITRKSLYRRMKKYGLT